MSNRDMRDEAENSMNIAIHMIDVIHWKFMRRVCKRINNHKLMKPLLKAAAQLGYSVRFVDDWGIWRDLNIPLKSTAIGACVFSKKKIIVSLKSREGRKFSIPDLAFIVAHEIRHALHKADGVFEGEYEVAFSDQAAKGAIEDDCDAFAMSYLEAKGVLKGGLAAQARKNGLKPVYLHLFKQ